MRKFKAESQKLLDMMINSVYTNKEIFLRELISNASDALDKRYWASLNREEISLEGQELAVRLTVDKDARTLTVSDNGCGMTKEELESDLGTIAKSGSQEFRRLNQGDNIDIIGQFGVGFYSAFMVAEKVTVISRSMDSDQAWQWESRGAEGYTVSEAVKEDVGTDVILKLREDTETDRFSDFLEEWRLSDIVKRYSDYVRYPIRMLRHKSRALPRPENAPADYQTEFESYEEDDVLNSMTPLWKKNPGEVKQEDYDRYYRERFQDYTKPARTVLSRAEGRVSYTALLFVPGKAPFDYYSSEFQKGLALYASGVLIMDKCADLLPDYFSFIRGLVDSEDVSLNLSREMLQQDHQMKTIASSLEKKIKSELLTFLRTEREDYETFFADFGRQLKFGVYSDFGAHAELLRELLLFRSAKEQKMLTLEEYTAAMGGEQKYIYYAAGDTVDRLAQLPAVRLVLERGCDVLLCPDDVDEFALMTLGSFKEKDFRNVNSGDLGLESEEEKQAQQEAAAENKELLAAIREALGGRVAKVAVSSLLKDFPATLTAEGPISLEMEKVLSRLPQGPGAAAKSTQVLNVNREHPVFSVLQQAQASGNQEKLADYAALLYDQARLIEGLALEDPAAFARRVAALMV
ncbi:MAG: molecular chaperone HtpG [Firmicutes bacterium]|nr:molecular chaperone HtpG [Bacillota bacterium]